jgi:flagellar biogenesis protein FliO
VPNFSEPVPFVFILESIGAIFALIAVGIVLVKKFKKDTM